MPATKQLKDETSFFDSINTFSDLEKLIHDGEAEGQHLECKNPISAESYNRDLKNTVANVISGFANAGGGIIIFGISTTQKEGMDLLTQIEPIGLVKKFAKKLEVSIPMLVEPAAKTAIKIITEKSGDSRGVVLLNVFPTKGDPIRNIGNNHFFLRTSDQTPQMPYETIRRMFVGGSSPSIITSVSTSLIKRLDDGSWELPFLVGNTVTFPAKSVTVSITIANSDVCQKITAGTSFTDTSNINPGRKIYMINLNTPVHKNLNTMIGKLVVFMKKNKKKLHIITNSYAEHMEMNTNEFNLYLYNNGSYAIKSVD